MATPTATYRQRGDEIDYTPGTAVTGGDVIVIGEIVAVATRAIAADAKGSVTVEGVVRFPKAETSGSAITAGAKCYWDATNSVITTTASTHKVAGYCVAAAADDDATVDVKLARA